MKIPRSTWSNRACHNQLCSNTTQREDGYCSVCADSRVDVVDNHESNRGSSKDRGYDARWRAARIAYLKVYPFCEFHLKEGQYVPAVVVDHIEPHKGDAVLFWDKSNWQGLCAHCHNSVKQRMERVKWEH